MPDSTPWVLNVTIIARYEMYVEVVNGSACRFSIVDTNIIGIGRVPYLNSILCLF